MIFVTLGSQKFQFNRLLKVMDELIKKNLISEEVFAQIGYSDYIPKNYKYKDFLDREEFSKQMSEADIVITHGGTGAIIGAVKKGKKVIAVPRLAKYEEHVDNHQKEIVKQFEDMNFIYACENPKDLSVMIKKIREAEFDAYESNTQNVINSIKKYLDELS